MKGLGLAFVSVTKRLMASLSSPTDRKTPRVRRRRVSLAKKVSTALSQDAEVESPAPMPGKPGAHFGMFVSSVVVDDGMDRFSLRHPCLDGVEEADELLVAVALHVMPDDGAIEDVEGGEQRGCAVPFVVVRHRAGTAG